MKTLIIYFTGTFNTKFLVDKIKHQLLNENNDVDTFSIDCNSKTIDLMPYDLIIFSYPIYAFNMPIIFERYIKKLNLLPNKKYIIAKQSGEPISLNNSSSYTLIKLLKKNRGILLNEYHFLMPYNIHFRYEDNFIKELFNYNDKLLAIMNYEIKHNINRKVIFNLFYAFNSFIFKIQRFGAFLNSYFYKVDKNKCIMCKKCINSCPVNNISIINNKIRFSNKCIMCMRCSFYCPKNAINIGILEGWKVNGSYNLKSIDDNKSLNGDYLLTHTSTFFKLFPKKIKQVEKIYDSYFKK